ncbi:MAG TPA: hypothetical protein EYG73_09310 [Arcobacter sp.]|nr:hypothetical protein [Arcobacter sp.]
MNLPVELLIDSQPERKEAHQVVNKEKSVIEILEHSIFLYKELDEEILSYKRELRDIRVETTKLRGEKEKLQGHISSVVVSEIGHNEFFHEKPRDASNKEIESNNKSIKKETCKAIIQNAERVKDNILENRGKAEEAIEPLEKSIELLKIQMKYTKSLENTLVIFDKKRQVEDKIKESNDIISMLAEQLR